MPSTKLLVTPINFAHAGAMLWGKNYMIAWKSTLPASRKEIYAKKFQILFATKHLKVKFHSGEAENSKCKVDQAHKSLVILFVQQKSLISR